MVCHWDNCSRHAGRVCDFHFRPGTVAGHRVVQTGLHALNFTAKDVCLVLSTHSTDH